MESLRKLAKHCAVIVCALAFCLPEISEAETLYQITQIIPPDGYSQPIPNSINNIGQVVGCVSYGNGNESHAFLWSARSAMQDLGSLPGHSYSCALDINDTGQVVGISSSSFYDLHNDPNAFLWSAGNGMQDLGKVYHLSNISINNSGQIGLTKSIPQNTTHAFLWSASNGMQDLKTLLDVECMNNSIFYLYCTASYINNSHSEATDINDTGQLVGHSFTITKEYGFLINAVFLWDTLSGMKLFPNFPILLPNFNSPNVHRINNSGQIIGTYVADLNNGGIRSGFIYGATTGLRYLGSLESTGFGSTVDPKGINDLNQVVGNAGLPPSQGFIWSASDGIKALNDLIDSKDPLKGKVSIKEANDINDLGQIVASDSARRGFLLTPPDDAIDLLDPVPALLEGSAVSTNPDSLAKKGRLVEGVGADGVATLVLRIHAKSVGESITLTLDGASTDEAGALGVLGATPDALTTTVTAESTTEGPMAFALYRAPVDFAWNESHHSLQRRSVTLNASSSSGSFTTKSIDVVRLPVVLVHGVWGSSDDWVDSDIYKNNAVFALTFDYRKTNSEAFKFNSLNLLTKTYHSLMAFAKAKNIAIAQYDFVTHSMGGNIVRSMPIEKIYYSESNFKKGYVHKLITIGTPHLGSPIARELVKAENACFATFISSPPFNMNVKTDGAVGDLVGNGDGTGTSFALTRLQNLPMAMLAGKGVAIGLPYSTRFALKMIICNAPIIDKLSPDNYDSTMGTKKHDGIVPVTSALNNQEEWLFDKTIHSAGTAYLGMFGDSLPSSNSMVTEKVIELLNTPVTNMEFIQP